MQFSAKCRAAPTSNQIIVSHGFTDVAWLGVVIGNYTRYKVWPVSDCVDVVLLFYVHGKHLRSCRDGHLT